VGGTNQRIIPAPEQRGFLFFFFASPKKKQKKSPEIDPDSYRDSPISGAAMLSCCPLVACAAYRYSLEVSVFVVWKRF
jgi:hypothetical protein